MGERMAFGKTDKRIWITDAAEKRMRQRMASAKRRNGCGQRRKRRNGL